MEKLSHAFRIDEHYTESDAGEYGRTDSHNSMSEWGY